MSDSAPPSPPPDALALEVSRLREALELDVDTEWLEVGPLAATTPETDVELAGALNTFLSALKLPEVGADLRQAALRALTHDEAARLLTYLLSESMAYSDPKRELADAREGALAFLSLFGPECRLLTNSSLYTVLRPDGTAPPGGTSYGWKNLLTGATFECGLFAVGAGRIGLFWFTDED